MGFATKEEKDERERHDRRLSERGHAMAVPTEAERTEARRIVDADELSVTTLGRASIFAQGMAHGRALRAFESYPKIEIADLGEGQAVLVSGGRLTEGAINSLERFVKDPKSKLVVLELEDDPQRRQWRYLLDENGRMLLAEPSSTTGAVVEACARLVEYQATGFVSSSAVHEELTEAAAMVRKHGGDKP